MLDHFEKQHEVHIEKQCLAELRHPNILKLNKAFQDKKHLYFAIEYCRNSDLGKLINKLGKFNYKLAQFYSAEILSAIMFMYNQGIYHQDLKPENIGIDEFMHLKIFDFATANKVNKYFDLKTMKFIRLNEEYVSLIEKKTNNPDFEDNKIKIEKYNILLLSHLFVGTPEYVSPEVLEHNYSLIGPGVDIWAFGIMLYLFFTGHTPFKAKTEQETLENIKNINYTFDNTEIPDDAKDLISKILVKDPTKRIGYNSRDYSEIKNHPFFNGIKFEELEFEDPPILEYREVLEKLGYKLPNIGEESTENNKNSNFENELHEDKKEIDIDDNMDNDDLNNNLRFSANNFEELKKNLKGVSIEHKLNYEKGIDDDDMVLLEEKLQKKSPWLHYNTRVVKFFSKGHIDYFEPKTKELKGTFIVNSDCHVNVIDEYRFEIVTLNRNYYFKHKNKKIANEWGDKINYFISKCAEKKNK
jgi:3-phosphoinositide dependent protein kinase-1